MTSMTWSRTISPLLRPASSMATSSARWCRSDMSIGRRIFLNMVRAPQVESRRPRGSDAGNDSPVHCNPSAKFGPSRAGETARRMGQRTRDEFDWHPPPVSTTIIRKPSRRLKGPSMMIASRSVSLLTVVLACLPAAADSPAGSPSAKLPLTGLAPAKIQTGLCLLKYRVSTNSPDCQAFFDQGLGYFYSYVWMEASRSFETAVQKDPECALAWWGLSRALERWGKNQQATKALLKSHELRDHASHREQQLILARMQEKGQIAGVGDSVKRHQAAVTTIDAMISLYDDDQEAWMYRAQLASGGRLFGGQTAAVPFYKALLRINPLHPGANHELVHYYENVQRPALGWVYAER